MDALSVSELLGALRRIGGEPERVETKRAQGGLPRSARETLSAFANTDGGTLLLGVDEASGFAVVPLDDPVSLRDGLVQMSRDDLTPPLQISTQLVEVEGGVVVVAEIPPAPADQRPVYVTARGIVNGAFLRGGDGDRGLSQAEIALMVGSRSQPAYDREPVPGTSIDDLDQDSLRRTLQRLRASSQRLDRADDSAVLRRLGITSDTSSETTLTLAGLLTFGQFPQQWFPQLMVSVVVHPSAGSGQVRFLDNVTARGPIPELVETTLNVLRRNLAVRAMAGQSGGRYDEDEYPMAAIREVIVNALMHRDYSPVTRGTQVQVDLHPDRLEVRSPGGLHGGVSVDELGEEGISSSRNAVLASLLSDAYLPSSKELVAENRSSGIPMMLDLVRQSGMPRPVFTSTVTSFMVSMSRSELLGPAVRAWLAGLYVPLPTPAHRLAMAMLRAGPITNATLRQWGVDRIEAGQVLRDLVEHGPVVREGGRRYARYLLDPAALGPVTAAAGPDRPGTGRGAQAATEAALRRLVLATRNEVADVTGLPRTTVVRHLNELIARGVVVAEGAPRSPQRRYRWVGPSSGDSSDSRTE